MTPTPCVPHPIPRPSRRCLRTHCPGAHSTVPAARTAPVPAALTLAAFRLQVKIWFQNKRSKFKKLLKQGSNPHESDPLPGSAALSPRSPALPPVWDVSASAKGVNMPPNSYMPGYSHWYSSPHQDTMQRPQMM